MAYWNFENGVDGAQASPAPAADGQYSGALQDVSGNSFDASQFFINNTGMTYSSNVPAATVPQLGVPNLHSYGNSGTGFFSASTTDNGNAGAPNAVLNSWEPTAWTLEAAFTLAAVTGNKTVVGRDGNNSGASPLYFGTRGGDEVVVDFQDVAGNRHAIVSTTADLLINNWYALAATSDGSTLNLYLKDITGDSAYSLIGSADLTGSLDPALTTGTGDGGDWNVGDFSFGRGLFNGGHVDRIGTGDFMDDIRLSDVALSPSQFLYSVPEPSAYALIASLMVGVLLLRRRR